ncbi:hypothetical protein G7Y89_g10897 [Cudoniella acicularis]|uniref:Uncharacterized protein n=1 Tax=Cudoniella acicularis TaxID=354080 RepID=A0A8H4RBW5_9HELO|nr:hypothetical protein G7Y89_g10897 [Cudoniella acicularis]
MFILNYCLPLLAYVSPAWALISQPDFAANILAANQLYSSNATHFEKRDSVPAGYVASPYYPTPNGGWVSNWAAAYAKAEKVVANMTLAEKVNLTTGTGPLQWFAYLGSSVNDTDGSPRSFEPVRHFSWDRSSRQPKPDGPAKIAQWLNLHVPGALIKFQLVEHYSPDE